MTSDHIKQIANIITEDPDVLLEVDERLRELERQSYTDLDAAKQFIAEAYRQGQLDHEKLFKILAHHPQPSLDLAMRLANEAAEVVTKAVEAAHGSPPLCDLIIWDENDVVRDPRQAIHYILVRLFKEKGEYKAHHGWSYDNDTIFRFGQEVDSKFIKYLALKIVSIGDVIRAHQRPLGVGVRIRYLVNLTRRFPLFTVDGILRLLEIDI